MPVVLNRDIKIAKHSLVVEREMKLFNKRNPKSIFLSSRIFKLFFFLVKQSLINHYLRRRSAHVYSLRAFTG